MKETTDIFGRKESKNNRIENRIDDFGNTLSIVVIENLPLLYSEKERYNDYAFSVFSFP